MLCAALRHVDHLEMNDFDFASNLIQRVVPDIFIVLAGLARAERSVQGCAQCIFCFACLFYVLSGAEQVP